MRAIVWLILAVFLGSCAPNVKNDAPVQRVKSSNWDDYQLEIINPKVEALISKDAKVEKLGEGFSWTEGPVWDKQHNMLLFSDVPNNVIYKWTKDDGIQIFLTPSGYLGENDYSSEPGSNGLMIGQDGSLYLCQHGNRTLAKMKTSLDAPSPNFEFLVNKYDEKKLNSPNDLCQSADGAIYFTDPPYGLPGQIKSEIKELPFQGVYRWHPKEGVTLLIDSLTRPNGIALSPGDKYLYVSNSDSNKPIWMKYSLTKQGYIFDSKVLYNAAAALKNDRGLPDGLKIDRGGNVFATGPGGVWIFGANDQLLGKIKVGQLEANCALDEKEEFLYMTADDYLLRVLLK